MVRDGRADGVKRQPLHWPTTEPVAIPYRRWRHRRDLSIVEVESVRNHCGRHGYYTTVLVRDKKGQSSLWPAKVFIQNFKPVGRKKIALSAWARL